MGKTFLIWILSTCSTSLSPDFPSKFQLRIFFFPVSLHICLGHPSLEAPHLGKCCVFLVNEWHFMQRNECLLMNRIQTQFPSHLSPSPAPVYGVQLAQPSCRPGAQCHLSPNVHAFICRLLLQLLQHMINHYVYSILL